MADEKLKRSRTRGAILLFLGLFLAIAPAAVIGGWIPIFAAPDGKRLLTLEGAGPETLLVVLLVVLLTGLGAASAAYGAQQISTGRPSRRYMRLLVRLLTAMMFITLVMSLVKTLRG